MSDCDRIETIESPTLKETIHRCRLSSGLRVYFCPKKGFRKRYACYSTHYGSVDNEFAVGDGERQRVPDGIAHFLEHTLFETEEGNVSDLFARHGAYSNAATSFTTTTYIFAASERFWPSLELLVRFVENPSFRADRIDKERGIIEQEIKGYDDSPDWVGYRTILEGLFSAHPIRIDIAGTVESIAKIDVEKLQKCYDAFYHPRNMALFVVGDLDPDELLRFVRERSRAGLARPAVSGRHYPEEPREVARKEARLEMEVAIPKLLLGFKEIGVPLRGDALVRGELVGEMLVEALFGRGSDTFRDLYEAGLVMDDFSASYSAGAGIGYALVGGDTPEPEKLRGELIERCRRLRGDGVSEEEFQRQKRKFIGGFIRSFNSLEYIANNYTFFRFRGYDLFDAVDLLGRVTREEVEERWRELLDLERVSSVTTVPKG